MSSLSATTLPRQFQSMDAVEDDLSFPSPSISEHLLVSLETPFEEGLGSEPDTNSNASSLDVFEARHGNSPRAVAIEEDEGASQVLLIPHTSPFFSTPRSTPGSDYSSPSVCPTLSGKFDLVHSAPNTPSSTTVAKQITPAPTKKLKRDQVVSLGLLQRRQARMAA